MDGDLECLKAILQVKRNYIEKKVVTVVPPPQTDEYRKAQATVEAYTSVIALIDELIGYG